MHNNEYNLGRTSQHHRYLSMCKVTLIENTFYTIIFEPVGIISSNKIGVSYFCYCSPKLLSLFLCLLLAAIFNAATNNLKTKKDSVGVNAIVGWGVIRLVSLQLSVAVYHVANRFKALRLPYWQDKLTLPEWFICLVHCFLFLFSIFLSTTFRMKFWTIIVL